MQTEIATGIAAGSVDHVAGRLSASIEEGFDGAAPELLLVFASTDQPLDELMPLVAAGFPESVVLGCSTAGEFVAEGDRKSATSWFALRGDFKISAGLGEGLAADPAAAVSRAADDLPSAIDGYPSHSALMLLDPLAGTSEEAVLVASSLLGDRVRLAGGAAGDDLQMTTTYVSLGGRVASDAVVLASIFSRHPLGLGVCHGHQPLSRPLAVTHAEGNVVHEIEGRPAWEVWKEETRDDALRRGVDPERLERDREGAFLLRYEAGLETGGEYKIRAPLSRDDEGAISFACGIPTGSVFRITESAPARQVDSAREAARRALAQLDGEAVAGAVVFDCICRNLILGDGFAGAVQAISEELDGAPLAGFETYGEIALDAGDLSGFHNTTTVVLAFPKGSA